VSFVKRILKIKEYKNRRYIIDMEDNLFNEAIAENEEAKFNEEYSDILDDLDEENAIKQAIAEDEEAKFNEEYSDILDDLDEENAIKQAIAEDEEKKYNEEYSDILDDLDEENAIKQAIAEDELFDAIKADEEAKKINELLNKLKTEASNAKSYEENLFKGSEYLSELKKLIKEEDWENWVLENIHFRDKYINAEKYANAEKFITLYELTLLINDMLMKNSGNITLEQSFETGKNLKTIKDIVKHKIWRKWLKAYMKISKETAVRYMKLYNDYKDDELSLFLVTASKSKAFHLFKIHTIEQRNDLMGRKFFINGKYKTGTEMSADELGAVMKKYKEAEAEIIKNDPGFKAQGMKRSEKISLSIELYKDIIERTEKEFNEEAEKNQNRLKNLSKKSINEILNLFPERTTEEEAKNEIINALTFYRDSKQENSLKP
jgi:hypothetical protein